MGTTRTLVYDGIGTVYLQEHKKILATLRANELPGLIRCLQEIVDEREKPEEAKCPWCGSANEIHSTDQGFFLGCPIYSCGYSGPQRKTQAEAIKAFLEGPQRDRGRSDGAD